MNRHAPDRRPPRLSEDWLALAVGAGFLLVSLAAVLLGGGDNPLAPWLALPGKWVDSPAEGLAGRLTGVAGAGLATLAAFGAAVALGGENLRRFVPGFLGVYAIALLAFVLSKQTVVDHWGLGYVLWGILLGLLLSNTVGVPGWMRPALRGELYTKAGLVLLGAELLIGKLLAFGLPGVCIAWVVTPVVLITTFWFGQRVLKIDSPSLNMVVSADMSVCGVSAAIATASATRAKKEELSLAIGMSVAFTACLMVLMPLVVRWTGMPAAVGGAWIGGVIDSTGAVGAAGALLSTDGDNTALVAAATVKMIQNVLIGVIAFGVAVYWVSVVEPSQAADETESVGGVSDPARNLLVGGVSDPESGAQAGAANGAGSGSENPPTAYDRAATPRPRPDLWEIWRRFPKFILGFFGASLLASAIHHSHPQGPEVVESLIIGSTKTLRNWCFCLAFTSIGLETHFRTLAQTMGRGKPLVLYACGQTLNIVLTLLMSWLMLGLLFPGAADAIAQ